MKETATMPKRQHVSDGGERGGVCSKVVKNSLVLECMERYPVKTALYKNKTLENENISLGYGVERCSASIVFVYPSLFQQAPPPG